MYEDAPPQSLYAWYVSIGTTRSGAFGLIAGERTTTSVELRDPSESVIRMV